MRSILLSLMDHKLTKAIVEGGLKYGRSNDGLRVVKKGNFKRRGVHGRVNNEDPHPI